LPIRRFFVASPTNILDSLDRKAAQLTLYTAVKKQRQNFTISKSITSGQKSFRNARTIPNILSKKDKLHFVYSIHAT